MPAQRSPLESWSGVTPSKVSGWSRSSSPDGAKAGSYVPSRGSTSRRLTPASRTVSTIVDAMPKYRLAVMSIVRPGSTRPMASLVISVSTASVGVMSTLTPNPPATPAKAAAMPAIGWRPTLWNAAAPSGMSTR